MGNIFDYLSWRGDLSFQADPFNEVDNLVLSYLAYVNYDDVIPVPGQSFITIKELSDRFFAAHSPEELAMDKSFVRDAPDVLKAMADTKRFQDALIGNYVNDIDVNRVLQMSASEIRLSDGTSYVAFRGTDDRIVSWKEDFFLAVGEVAAHTEGANYLKKIMIDNNETEYRIGGHSKGGNLAVAAAAYCGTENQKYIKAVYCNDGPGFRSDFFRSQEYQKIQHLIYRILPNESFVGMLLGHDTSPEIIKSDVKGIMQHSAMTWQILGNRFVRENELAGLSLAVDEVMKQWLGAYSNEQRIQFINDLFAVLEASGAETLTELQNGGLSSLIPMKKRFDTLDPETKSMIDRLLKKLINRWTEHISGSLFLKTEKDK